MKREEQKKLIYEKEVNGMVYIINKYLNREINLTELIKELNDFLTQFATEIEEAYREECEVNSDPEDPRYDLD